MKTTKAQARDAYDSFFGAMRALNGGTSEENFRQAPRCLELMEENAARCAEVAANPNKALAADAWMMTELKVTIPARVASFKARYPHASKSAEIIPFPSAS